MTSMCRLLPALVVCLVPLPVLGQEPIQMGRMPDISPDGKLVAFSYLGDIWVVEAIGGIARPVTMHRAHDIYPCFSPDGRWIAFSSNRYGQYDVFVIPVHSGKPRRLTFDSADDLVCGWSPDGKSVLFASARSTAFPRVPELYSVPFDPADVEHAKQGGRERKLGPVEAKYAVWSPTGDRLAYVRGPGDASRKGYRGSSNDDIWICNADGSSSRRATWFNGQDGWPMWSADGQMLYYVSEEFGTPANIVRTPLAALNTAGDGKPPRPQQITSHTEDAVRRARISVDGAWIVYECGADMWVVSTRDGSRPRKLAIEVHTDDKSNTDRMATFTSGATEYALSADEKHVAFVVHGEIFLQAVSPTAKAVRLTNTHVTNHGVSWAPDGNSVIFISDKDGYENVWSVQSADPAHPKIAEAHQFKEPAQLTRSKEPSAGASWSPDGRKIAFLRSGKLWTMKPDGSEAKPVIEDLGVFDYDWSPDSKWLVLARMDGSFGSEVYVVPANGPTADNPVRNVTRYATFNGDVSWSSTGGHIAFISQRRGAISPYVLPLRKPAAPGVTDRPDGPVEIDWDDLHLRAQRAAPSSATAVTISPDGGKVAFRSDSQGDDLWVASANGSQLQRLTTGNQKPNLIRWSKRKSPLGGYPDVIYFLDGQGQIKMLRVGITGENNSVTVPFSVKMNIKADEEFQEMFDQAWRTLSDQFYDNKFHGTNWEAMRAKYRPLVKHVALKEDLYALLYLMMGELNASHLGVGGPTPGVPDEPTADLGLLFDEAAGGKGLKISEVLKRGPADRRGLNLKAGDFVMTIDGQPIAENTNIASLLNGKVGQAVVLQVAGAAGEDSKSWRRVEVQGQAAAAARELMYERWVDKNAKRVEELSKGKLGYIHIPSMDEAGLERFVRALYSDGFDKEGLVLDVRYNGGGFTHDQVLNYLGAKEHTTFRQRSGIEGTVLRSPDRKWSRPLVMLINNRSFSDAEILPNAFRTLGLGKLIGEPTGGHVIGTGSVRLIDGSLFRVPRIGVFTTKGVNMDREGVSPDVLIETHPDQLAKGVDVQIEKAVTVLQEAVVEWKKKASGSVAVQPSGK
jgi:tricorn protease